MTIPFEPVQRLHHFSWRCRDAEETRVFYEDVVGLPFVHVIRATTAPSTGEYCPYVHLFFELRDQSYIAFFDMGNNESAIPSPNTPAWVNHLALKVESMDTLTRAKVKLERAGIKVLGVTDHGFVNSIYFFDPNGIRLELTVDTQDVEAAAGDRRTARIKLDAWSTEKAAR